MTVVRTVMGDVEASSLGRTSCHEHIFLDARVWLEDVKDTPSVQVPVDPDTKVDMSTLGLLHRNPVLLNDNMLFGDDEELALKEVQEFKDAGGDCIVEVTCCNDTAADGVTNMGRDVLGLRRVAEKTGLKIVSGTGFYLEGTHPAYVGTESVEQLAARMINDIEEGVGDTGIRCGLIGEIGTTSFTEREQKVLRACAIAHLATGAAVSLHTHEGFRTAEESVKLLMAEGVKPNRIIVGHMDENMVSFEPGLAYLDYHRRVADLGVFIEYDTWGAEWYYNLNREPMDSERACAIAIMINEGHADQILFGCDMWLKICYKRYGGQGYAHSFTGVPALLHQAGVDDAHIDKIQIDNPRRALALSTQ